MAKQKAKRKTSKSELRARALEVELPSQAELCIVGSGAAGIAAAISAAEAGAKVLVLEQDVEPLKRLLATGNGRCNISNVELEPKRYNDEAFVASVFGAQVESALDTILSFFKGLGLRFSLEEDRLYPMSQQAASVRNVLLRRAHELGVSFVCLAKVRKIQKQDEGFELQIERPTAAETEETETLSLSCKKLIVATGSITNLLADSELGFETSAFVPKLCPAECEDSPLFSLDGRRAKVRLNLSRGAFPFWSQRGEVLFRSFGLSGIVVFNATRQAEAGDIVHLDLLPDMSEGELRQILGLAVSSIEDLVGKLDGVLDPEIYAELLRCLKQNSELPHPEEGTIKVQELGKDLVDSLIKLIKDLPFRYKGTYQVNSSQVSQGGLALSELQDPLSFETKIPYLYCVGEALNIDGDCGGFNLSWAWISGMSAGKAAATKGL